MCTVFGYLTENRLLFFWQAYSSKDLGGLKVEHRTEAFREGQDIVLTLKDKGKALYNNEWCLLCSINPLVKKDDGFCMCLCAFWNKITQRG